jgi:hypothetical protein
MWFLRQYLILVNCSNPISRLSPCASGFYWAISGFNAFCLLSPSRLEAKQPAAAAIPWVSSPPLSDFSALYTSIELVSHINFFLLNSYECHIFLLECDSILLRFRPLSKCSKSILPSHLLCLERNKL